ncbi:hypothetical protein IWQ62_004889 [Dispira parvispora]|uniref:Uncharacterized protein n=1 Tax=Dispira parvispora TaxID=1520584 RepID=A0A9W8E069_9FUNG|nr:hypothetical protein IWQ62_004889 [Dispira parvispora]
MSPKDITGPENSAESLKEEFSDLLKIAKKLSEEDYKKLKELEDDANKTAEDGNELLAGLGKKWAYEANTLRLRVLTPEYTILHNYKAADDMVQFLTFPLLHACNHGSPRYVAQLLSLIKSNLMDNRNSANEENTDTSSDGTVDDTLFYEFIIPQILLTYVQDKGIEEAKKFVDSTEEAVYHLYDTDDRRNRREGYRVYLDFIEEHKGPHALLIYHYKSDEYQFPSEKLPSNSSPTIKSLLLYNNFELLIYDRNREPDRLLVTVAPSDREKLSKMTDNLQAYT